MTIPTFMAQIQKGQTIRDGIHTIKKFAVPKFRKDFNKEILLLLLGLVGLFWFGALPLQPKFAPNRVFKNYITENKKSISKCYRATVITKPKRLSFNEQADLNGNASYVVGIRLNYKDAYLTGNSINYSRNSQTVGKYIYSYIGLSSNLQGLKKGTEILVTPSKFSKRFVFNANPDFSYHTISHVALDKRSKAISYNKKIYTSGKQKVVSQAHIKFLHHVALVKDFSRLDRILAVVVAGIVAAVWFWLQLKADYWSTPEKECETTYQECTLTDYEKTLVPYEESFYRGIAGTVITALIFSCIFFFVSSIGTITILASGTLALSGWSVVLFLLVWTMIIVAEILVIVKIYVSDHPFRSAFFRASTRYGVMTALLPFDGDSKNAEDDSEPLPNKLSDKDSKIVASAVNEFNQKYDQFGFLLNKKQRDKVKGIHQFIKNNPNSFPDFYKFFIAFNKVFDFIHKVFKSYALDSGQPFVSLLNEENFKKLEEHDQIVDIMATLNPIIDKFWQQTQKNSHDSIKKQGDKLKIWLEEQNDD